MLAIKDSQGVGWLTGQKSVAAKCFTKAKIKMMNK
jgi:hypothetical protein